VVGDRGRIVQFERVTDPSRAFAVHEEPAGERGALLGNFIYLPRVPEACDDHLELLGIQSVPDVFWGEHRGAGADHGAELDQGYHEHPPLGDPGQDKEDFIPLLDPVLDQDVGCLVGEVLQVTEGKFLFASLLADPDHRELVPVLLCPCVNNVVAKIEAAGDCNRKIPAQFLVIFGNCRRFLHDILTRSLFTNFNLLISFRKRALGQVIKVSHYPYRRQKACT